MRSGIRVPFAVLFATALLASFFAGPPSVASAQQKTGTATAPLPFDSAVTVGTLSNGMRYYIRENHKPEKRAELRLVVNAGSVLEDEDQRGLAHMVEHMAFRGTKQFAGNQISSYLESVGMRYGPDINAFTSFDETVYMITVPTDTAAIVDKGFQILSEWAHNVAFEPAQIAKERPVVIEEWRLGQGAENRMQNKWFPVLFSGSKYGDRLPIGLKSVLETYTPATLRRFYDTWYRPDHISIIAVGDVDAQQIERERMHLSLGEAAGAVALEAVAAPMIDQRLCEDAARRVAGAQKEHVVDSCHPVQAFAQQAVALAGAAMAGAQHAPSVWSGYSFGLLSP